MLVNGIGLPKALQLTGKKALGSQSHRYYGNVKFGDMKSYTSLDLLANLLGINSSKNLMDGSQVNHCYHIEKSWEILLPTVRMT